MSMVLAIKTNDGRVVMVDSALSSNKVRTNLVDDKGIIINKGKDLICFSGSEYIIQPLKKYILETQEDLDFDEILAHANRLNNELANIIKLFEPKKSILSLMLYVFKGNDLYKTVEENGVFKFVKNDKQITYSGYFEHDGRLYDGEGEINSALNDLLSPAYKGEKHVFDCMVDIMRYFNCSEMGGTARFYAISNNSDNNEWRNIANVKIDNIPVSYHDEVIPFTVVNNELMLLSEFNNRYDENQRQYIYNGIAYMDKNILLSNNDLMCANFKSDYNVLKFDGDAEFTGDLNLGGNIVLGGNITWNTSDPKTLQALRDAGLAIGAANGAYDLASDAKVVAQSASGNIKKLADGTYTGGTFINGTRIEAPEIYGGQIYGGEFRDLTGKAKLILNPSSSTSGNADLNLYSGNNIAFQIYDHIIGGLDLNSYGNNFLTVGQWGTYAKGKWDFSTAEEVKGLTARFA